MLKIQAKNIRVEEGPDGQPLSLSNSLMCGVEVKYEGSALSYDDVRVNSLLSEIFSVYLAISFRGGDVYLYLDGYEAYLKFEGDHTISVTLSDPEFPSNVTHLEFEGLRKMIRNLLDDLRRGVSALKLDRNQKLEVTHTFQYGAFLL